MTKASQVAFILSMALIFMLSTKMISVQGCTNYEDGYNSGYVDGLNNPYNTTIFDEKNDRYLQGYADGFMEGCLDVEGNTEKACENAKDG
jgi:hypothetical protein